MAIAVAPFLSILPSSFLATATGLATLTAHLATSLDRPAPSSFTACLSARMFLAGSAKSSCSGFAGLLVPPVLPVAALAAAIAAALAAALGSTTDDGIPDKSKPRPPPIVGMSIFGIVGIELMAELKFFTAVVAVPYLPAAHSASCPDFRTSSPKLVTTGVVVL